MNMPGKKAGNQRMIPIEANGGVPVNVQDQTTKPVLLNFNNISNGTTLLNAAVKGARTIDLTSTAGTANGKYIIIFDPLSLNFSFYTQIGAVATNTITLDNPLDYGYPAGAFVDIGDTNLGVDGSTPQIFGLRGTGSPTGVELTVDVTGINYFCLADTAVDLSKFADITALTNGIVLRKRDGNYSNIANIKANGEIAAISETFIITSADNPVQGQHGFYGSAAFSGQENLGVAVRLPIGDDLEFIVQDDLSGITYLAITASGHIVQD